MKRSNRTVEAIIASALVLAIIASILICGMPAFSAVEMVPEDGDDAAIAVTGAAAHRTASFDGVPAAVTDTLIQGVDRVFLDTDELYLSINERHQLIMLDSYSNTVNGRADFTSSDDSAVSVSAAGVITARKSGKAVVAARDRVTGNTLECKVYVGYEIAPTQAPTEKPTDEPPEPTEKPTQRPTQKPTQKPTQPATQAPPRPTTAPTPTQAPTTPASGETLSLNASSATVYKGNYYHVVAKSNATVSFTSSDTSVATVNSSGIVTARATGTATITAKTSTKSATCKITVVAGSSVNISRTSATVVRFMTFLMTSSTSGVSWSSSDTSVATVKDGFVYGAKAGTAVITAKTSSGAATCLMTVKPSNVVRFAYASPNCALKNQTVTLVCITDTMRTGVRFAVGSGSDLKYVNATSCTKDGDTYVWKGTTSFSKAGTYPVKAYSQFNGGTEWYTCADGETTAFVADSSDKTTTVCANRRASDEVIDLIATFEGFSKSAYADVLTGDPTLGYGRVVYEGESFYNDLTEEEAYAYLVQTVNNGGYTADVNAFLVGNGVKFNQRHFDALVCFVYNVGTGPLYSDNELIAALLDCSDGSGTAQKSYYINDDEVNFRKGAGTGYDIIKELDYGTSLTVLSTSDSPWYYVQTSDGVKGYVHSDYISSRTSGGSLDLNYIKKQNFINKLCQYHHAGGCIWGLLYRRIDEVEIFFYGDYEPDYGENKYNISFTCAKNPSFHT